MKVYLYYLIDKKSIKLLKERMLMDWIGIDNDDVEDTCLYAYTRKKKIAESFEKTRNMEIFHKVVKEVDDYEYEQIAKDAGGYAELINQEFDYPFSKECLMFTDQIKCKVPITMSESWFAVENYKESIMDFIDSHVKKIHDIRIFRDDIYHILKDMDYNDVVSRNNDYIRRDIGELSPLAEYSCHYAWENQIVILLALYKGFFNETSIVEVIVNGKT